MNVRLMSDELTALNSSVAEISVHGERYAPAMMKALNGGSAATHCICTGLMMAAELHREVPPRAPDAWRVAFLLAM